MVVIGGTAQPEAPPVVYAASLPTLQGKVFKELRFRFAGRTYTREVPFTIEGMELP